MRYFRIEEDKSLGYTGFVNGVHKWGLPGIDTCPACKSTWADIALTYPSVDLTPVASLGDFEKARAEPIEEYERLRELVRPLLPPGAVVEPGSRFGPLVGNAQGSFGQFVSNSLLGPAGAARGPGETPGRGPARAQGLPHAGALPPA